MNRKHYLLLIRLIRLIDRMIDYAVIMIVVVIMLYGLYGLYDTNSIYNDTSLSEIIRYKPVEDKESEGFNELVNLNDDICGWMSIEGTNIDYPLLYGEDNYYYLNRDYKGDYSLIGSLFVDYRNNRDFSNIYTLIYGHSMDGDKMFGKLSSFLNADFFNENIYGEIYFNGELHKLKIFASVYTDAYDKIFYYPQSIKTSKDKTELINYIRNYARQYRDIPIDKQKIIGLSTCSSNTTNGRIIVFAIIE